MRRLFALFILVMQLLWGITREEATLEVYEKLLPVLWPHKELKVYASDEALYRILEGSQKFQPTPDPLKADILLVQNIKEYRKLRTIIAQEHPPYKRRLWVALDYKLFKHHREMVAAFYWRKGRKQLLFLRQRLKENHIELDEEFERYILDWI